jgi:peptide/nickel transport system permease protein
MSTAEVIAREVELEAPSGLWKDAWRRLRRNRGALVGMTLVAFFVLVALFAPLIAPYSPTEGELSRITGGRCCPGPSGDFLFGVDQQGRDVLSRIIYGARFSLLIGVVSVLVGLSIGMVIGSIAGYVGGVVDSTLMRIMDVMLAVPGLLLAIGLVAILGQGLWQIIDVAGLGFLGLGPPDPATPEWGTMLTDTTRYLQTAPHLALIPGAAIIVSVLGFNLIGDGLREALDPKLRGR